MIRMPNLVNPEQLMNDLCSHWLAQPSLLIPVPKPRIYYWTKPSNAVGDDDTGLRIRMPAPLKAHNQDRLTWLLSLRLPLPVHRRPQ